MLSPSPLAITITSLYLGPISLTLLLEIVRAIVRRLKNKDKVKNKDKDKDRGKDRDKDKGWGGGVVSGRYLPRVAPPEAHQRLT